MLSISKILNKTRIYTELKILKNHFCADWIAHLYISETSFAYHLYSKNDMVVTVTKQKSPFAIIQASWNLSLTHIDANIIYLIFHFIMLFRTE